jgi:hypothetical protein
MEIAFFDELIKTLKDRFAKNMRRHTGIDWSSVQAKLEASPEKLQTLYEMERTGGEPDVVGYDEKTGSCSGSDQANNLLGVLLGVGPGQQSEILE